MEKQNYMKLKGSQNLRQRLLLSTLSSTPILIDDIRADDTWPGLRPHEISLLRLLAIVCDDCAVEINETGTKLKYKPGIVMGGKYRVHDCGLTRSIGYFLEPLVVLGLFGKKPLSIRLKGITNDQKDPSLDTFRSTTLQILKRFGVPSEGLELKIENRGVPPKGGGEVFLSVPILRSSLTAVNWIDEGMVKRIRGVSFSTRVSSQFEKTMLDSACGIFNLLLPDVHVFTDTRLGYRLETPQVMGCHWWRKPLLGVSSLLIQLFPTEEKKRQTLLRTTKRWLSSHQRMWAWILLLHYFAK